MALDNFNGLRSEIENYLDRDDLAANVDGFIRLAEVRHERDVRMREMLVREPLTIDDRYAPIPDGFLAADLLRIITDRTTELKQRNLSELTRLRAEATQDGRPCYFAIHAEFEFERPPKGGQTFDAEIIYYKRVPRLSTSNDSNIILDRAPDLYLYGALLAAEPFLMNDERLQTWGQLYSASKDSVNFSAIKSRHAGPQTTQVVGPTP